MKLTAVARVLDTFPPKVRDRASVIVSDFIIAEMSLARACKLSPVGTFELLNLIWTRSHRDKKSSAWTVAKLLQTQVHYYRWQFNQALIQAARRGDLIMVRWVLAHFRHCHITKDVVEEAARRGQPGVLQMLDAAKIDGGIQWSDENLKLAAASGNWDLVHWLHSRTKSTLETKQANNQVVNSAFEQNKLEEVKWAIANGFRALDFSFSSCNEANWRLRTEILEYVLERRIGDTAKIAGSALLQAAEIGDIRFIRWLINSHFPPNENPHYNFESALNAASRSGRLEVVSWLLMYMKKFNVKYDPSEAMFAAASYGQLEVMQCLYTTFSRDPTIDLFQVQSKDPNVDDSIPDTAVDVAACNGHLDILRCLHDIERASHKRHKEGGNQTSSPRRQNLNCTTAAMDSAAANGHRSVVMWLHGNRSEGCTSAAMDRAAANGHLQVVRWLVCNRYESCTDSAIDSAAARRFHTGAGLHGASSTCCAGLAPNMFYETQLSLVKYLHLRSTITCASSAIDSAALTGNLRMLQWLHENTPEGCTTKAMDTAAWLGRLDIVQWLDANRWEGCTTAAMDGAAAEGHLAVVKWLYANRPEGCTAKTMDEAAANGHLRVVQWLHVHCTGARVISAMRQALQNTQFEVAYYLKALCCPSLASVNNRSSRKTNLALADSVESRTPERPVMH